PQPRRVRPALTDEPGGFGDLFGQSLHGFPPDGRATTRRCAIQRCPTRLRRTRPRLGRGVQVPRASPIARRPVGAAKSGPPNRGRLVFFLVIEVVLFLVVVEVFLVVVEIFVFVLVVELVFVVELVLV